MDYPYPILALFDIWMIIVGYAADASDAETAKGANGKGPEDNEETPETEETPKKPSPAKAKATAKGKATPAQPKQKAAEKQKPAAKSAPAQMLPAAEGTKEEDTTEADGKEKGEKAEGGAEKAEGGEEKAEGAAGKGTAGGKKKKPGKAEPAKPKGAAARRAALAEMIRKEQERRREEEERKKREEEERLRREEEERKKREEEERRREEIRLKKKAEKKERQKALAAERKKKEEEERLAQRRALYVGSAPLPAASEPASEAEKRKRPIYAKKKKPQQSADSVSTATGSSAPSLASSVQEEQDLAEEAPEQQEEKQEQKQEQQQQQQQESSGSGGEEEDWEHVAESWEKAEPAPVLAKPADEAKKLAPEEKKSTPPAAAAAAAASAKAKAPSDSEAKKPAPPAAKGKAPAGKGAKKAEESEKVDPELRSPICCVLGHVDVGKTKLLDKIRRTNVQEGEAGGITQQIGATYFPLETLRERTRALSEKWNLEFRIPGLLVIDTPGHESFNNLRSRGSSLCDLAVLVVDLMHGLEKQTLESIELLRRRKCPFVVALNKVDRLYGWQATPNAPFQESFKQQKQNVRAEFEQRVRETITQFAEVGLNAALYYSNPDVRKYVSLVPCSAITGEGVPDLLFLIVQLTQRMMRSQLVLSNELACTVLEVKVVEGFGTTIDVILSDGELHEGDTIVVCGMNGPIVTQIRALLTPMPCREIRVKGQYLHHKVLRAAQGIKIAAQDLEGAIAGSQLLVVDPNDQERLESAKRLVMKDFESVVTRYIDKSGHGVYVQASTLGSLEALLEFLHSVQVPVGAVALGPVHKKDVMRASVQLEHKREYAVVLAFDVKVTQDAADIAKELGVRIFTANIIYHLQGQFEAYLKELQEEERKASTEAVFPCVLSILPEYIIHKAKPIILGVKVEEGSLRVNTPICVQNKEAREAGRLEWIDLGRVTSIESNHKPVEIARKGDSVAVRIEGDDNRIYGRHFEHPDRLYSRISRESIDALKKFHREQVTKEDIQLLKMMKKLFSID